MSIINPQAFVDSIWDWRFLDNCFAGTKIKVSDIDGIVERNGYFLLIETKGTGVKIPFGQELMHKNLIKTGAFTVFVVWGDSTKNMVTGIRVMFSSGIIKDFIPCDNYFLIKQVSRWFFEINKKPKFQR